jgi:Fe2+ transport system protein FeoA
MKEWTEAVNIVAIPEPDRPTLSMVPEGGKAHVEQIFLPLAQKKRLLSLGLTCGTKIGVISNEKGRMIVAVRDSRLGLSPEVASRITYRSAG